MILIEESCKIYLDEMKMSRELGFDKEPHISIMCGTILHAVNTHQTAYHFCGCPLRAGSQLDSSVITF